MGQQYLIDTNAVIDYLGAKLPGKGTVFMNTVINTVPNVSIITKIEVLGYNTTIEAYQLLTDFMDAALIMELDEDIVNGTIAIRKLHKIKTPDAIIAATAVVWGFTLITRNMGDFKNIQGLQIVNPHELT
jgi:hypothetical protein